ncbi:esterase [Paenibacillus sp. FSL R7-0273]|uniref:alpha/beta hydrolase n=1 Tax=Paenibacillus sp. FSL R7-0273 TaxID=1536772 RepID=UPI0004F7475F|nr:alpha/beta hydrolase [Paenibacillus sp. FSL R7-0273]AIQ48834.1 esterase [Paenibacillus sp. FSL R7-0273]OMF91287.1 alpha/beta hydrolase [Paenibacillus sp. FSL R7-0273]
MKIELWPEGAPLSMGEGAVDRPVLHVYMQENGGPHAAVIVLPGGAYCERAAHEGEPVARWLNELGITAFVLDYRVAPYRHPAPMLDVQRAIRHVRQQAASLGIDPQRVGVLGFSAGGHLASTAGTHFDLGESGAEDKTEQMSSRPDFMILCYPVINLGDTGHVRSRGYLLGDNPSLESVKLLSSELQVTPDTPPAFIWQTTDDGSIGVVHTLKFAGAMARNGVPFELHSFMTGNHGLGLAQEHAEARAWPRLCAAWLKRIGVLSE